MRIDILTLFPSMFKEVFLESIIKRAIDSGYVDINLVNIRDFSVLNNSQVDDTPYGGGGGMVLMCDPIFKAILSVRDKDSKVIMLTPSGKLYSQKVAYDLSQFKHIILLCGHYEGFDERIKSIVDFQLSIGDYVLTGGEIAAMAVVDSIVRLIPGVISEESLKSESFNDNLLDYPVYTKPRVYNGMSVPDVLLSGDHKKIEEYRYNERVRITKEMRPDILE